MKYLFVIFWTAACGYVLATDFLVAPSGAPYSTITDALAVAQAGDRVLVQSGTYVEQIQFPRSGNAVDGWIELLAAPNHAPILDGVGFVGGQMVMISDKNYLRIQGFTIQNLDQINDGGGIRVIGACDHIEILENTISQMLGEHAMGITVYGTSTTAPIEHLLIQGNTIYDCQPSTSEALTLNGNITNFEVCDNLVHDVNNIGIDFIGGETDINPDPSLVARNGLCARNEVYHARSDYGGGWAGGIYVDGGRDIILDANIVWECDLGIEIGAENAGTNAQGIIVRNNRIFHNDKAGLVFGGYDASVGRTVALPEVGPTDMEGQARIAEGRIDQGADEYASLACLPGMYELWRSETSLPCGGSGILHILELTALLGGTCSCP